MPQHDFPASLKHYADAAVESSTRGRYVLIIMLTACGLSFFTYWNSRQSSWINSRVHTQTALLDKWGFECSELPDEVMSRKQCEQATRLAKALGQTPEFERLAYQEAELPALRASLAVTCKPSPDNPKVMSDTCKAAVTNIYSIARSSRKLARQHTLVGKLKDLQIDRYVTIDIPVFGVAIDANDNGILSGLTLLIILIWLRFSFLQEVANIKLAFALASEQGELSACYDYIAMRQLLTIARTRVRQSREIWDKIPRLLVFIPSIVLTLIFVNDYQTILVGAADNLAATFFTFSISFAAMALVIVFTLICLNQASELNAAWEEAYLTVRDRRSGQQTQSSPASTATQSEPVSLPGNSA